MSARFRNRWLCVCLFQVVVNSAGASEPPLPDVYRLGAYYGDDSYAFTLAGDWAVFDASRFNLGGAYVSAKGESTDLNSAQLQTGFDHTRGAWNGGIDVEYRNDETTGLAMGAEDTIETMTARLRTAYEAEHVRASLGVGRRHIELTLDLPRARQYIDTTRETDSTEYSLGLRFSGDPLAVYANGKYFDYDDPIQSLVVRADDPRIPIDGRPLLQEALNRFRARLSNLNFAAVRLANNFLDYTVTLGVDYSVGEHLLNLEVFRERVTGDGAEIDGVEAGWVLPLGTTADLETRVGGVHADAEWLPYGSVTVSSYR